MLRINFVGGAKSTLSDRNGNNNNIELNLIKSVYANRFGSPTNKFRNKMVKKIIMAWTKM